MIETSFVRWMQLREANEGSNLPPGYNPFTTLQQKAGDVAYFGVHDLSKFYKQNGQLPDLDPGMIQMKAGEVVNADPIEQTITIATERAPFHYGYHKLEDSKSKQNRKTDDQGRVLVTIPVTHLQNISHMMNNPEEGHIWLVVDGNTKYQQGLMREIRRKEIERSQGPQQPPMDNMGSDPAMGEQMPMNGPMGGMEDMSMGSDPAMGGQMPNVAQSMTPPEPKPQKFKPQFQMKGREVTPLQVAHYVPTITGHDNCWKRHCDIKRYEYVE